MSSILSLALLTAGCVPQTLKSNPHYVLGTPYQVGAVWYYPSESFDLDETGLATIAKDEGPRLTADGEVFDQTSLAASHPTIQLPAIARLTNLENGREVIIRLNDRGPGDPRRLLAVTQRTALLLDMPPGSVAQVRLQVLPVESHAAAESLPGAPSLGMSAVPREAVQVADLPLPVGVRQGNGRVLPAVSRAVPDAIQAPVPPLRLPEAVTQTVPRPGRLMVILATFDEYQYAVAQSARMAAAGARIVPVGNGRKTRFRVEIGPLPDVAHADAALDQALASGIPDARIVVD